jgi:hypothetical protein
MPFWETLYDGGAEVVLNGHAHNYERFAPQTPGGQADPEGGIRQFVVGTGGRSLNSFGTVRVNSEARIADAYGVTKLTLHPEGYDWQFVTAPGGMVPTPAAPAATVRRPLRPPTPRHPRSQAPYPNPTPRESTPR